MQLLLDITKMGKRCYKDTKECFCMGVLIGNAGQTKGPEMGIKVIKM